MFRPRLRPRRHASRRRRGIEIIELAFAMPVMTVLVFGTMEVCELLFLKESLAIASYEAGRLAAREDSDTATVQARFDSIMANRRVSDATITFTPPTISSLNPGDTIRIDVTAPFAANSTTRLVLSSVPDVTESVTFVRE